MIQIFHFGSSQKILFLTLSSSWSSVGEYSEADFNFEIYHPPRCQMFARRRCPSHPLTMVVPEVKMCCRLKRNGESVWKFKQSFLYRRYFSENVSLL